MKIIEGLRAWEVMKAYEEGKRIAFRSSNGEWEEGALAAEITAFDWFTYTYAIIDDTAPVIDWDGFDWDFFNLYRGLPISHENPELLLPIAGCPSFALEAGATLRESPFYPWFGGECPVPGNVEVAVLLRNRYAHTSMAVAFEWDRSKFDDEIIAFRLTGKVL